MSMLKIMVLASGDYFSAYGGGQVYVKNLVAAVKRKGHAVSVMSVSTMPRSEATVQEVSDAHGTPVWEVKVPQAHAITDHPVELQRELLAGLTEVLRRIGPDVVHANGWKSAAAKVCQDLGIPCVITAHHGGIVCPNGTLMNRMDAVCTLPTSMENCLACALHFVPGGDLWSPVVRRLPETAALSLGRMLKGRRNIPYVSPAFQVPLGIQHKLRIIEVLRSMPSRVVAPSRAIGSALVRNGLPQEKVLTIPHGITPLERKPLTPGLPQRPLRLGYIGRLAYVKGLHVLLQALQGVPTVDQYELHIYGEAANRSERRYAARLKTMAAKLPVIWHGKIPHEDVQRAYHHVDVMLLPSICLEVFGLTLVEALSAGRPVIATRCGGPEDIVTDGVNGLLVAPNDALALRVAIRRLIKNPTFVEEMANRVGTVQTLDAHADALINLYASVASK